MDQAGSIDKIILFARVRQRAQCPVGQGGTLHLLNFVSSLAGTSSSE